MMCSFLFAAFVFCLQRSFFVCNVRFLFAAFLLFAVLVFYLQPTFLFAAFLFCLQRFFLFAAFLFCLQHVPCGPSYTSRTMMSVNKKQHKKF